MAFEIVFVSIMVLLTLVTLANVPGPLLIAITAWIYGWQTDFDVFTSKNLLFFVILGLVALGIDNLFALFGAKKFGASKHGVIGAFLGTFAILFLGPIGLIIGPFLGAFIGEVAFGKNTSERAGKAALGAVIGVFTGIVAKTVMAIAMTAWFAIIVL